jgi:hypothetical protein
VDVAPQPDVHSEEMDSLFENRQKQVHRRPSFLFGLLAGIIVASLVWGTQPLLNAETPAADDSAARAPTGGVAARLGASKPKPVKEPTPLDECQERHAAQNRPLRTAAASLEQWDVHVAAMNQLVVGEITLDQAWQFWNQTRIGAARRLARYGSAELLLDATTARCPHSGHAHMASSNPLRSCAAAVDARAEELHEADIALSTWRQHVEHMEMLRNGEMTPEEAVRLWLENWRKGNRELKEYRAADRAAEGHTC